MASFFLYSRHLLSKQNIRTVLATPAHFQPVSLAITPRQEYAPLVSSFQIKHITDNTIVGSFPHMTKKIIPFFSANYMYFPEGYLIRNIPINILVPYNVYVPDTGTYIKHRFHLPASITPKDRLIFVELPNS